MRPFLTWLGMEYRRAAAALPSVVCRAAILVGVIGMAVFGARMYLASDETATIQVGYVGGEDELTALAIDYVTDMELFEGWCEFVPVGEDEGRTMLENGELSALIILPENIVQGIIDGTNTPAELYLSDVSAALSLVVEEIASAGVGMLQVAQAEIYATYDLAAAGGDVSNLSAMCEEIDRYNLRVVADWGTLFQEKHLAATGSDGLAIYYASALLCIYLLLAGLFIGKYCTHTRATECIVKYRLGVPYTLQLVGRTLVTASLLLTVAVLPMLAWCVPVIRKLVQPSVTASVIIALLFALLCLALYTQFLYMLVGHSKVAPYLIGMSAVIQGYVSGCFIPSALLPDVIEQIAPLFPATYIKGAAALLFGSYTQEWSQVCVGLLVWSVIFAILCLLIYGRESTHELLKLKKSCRYQISPLPLIALKRLARQGAFWLGLLATTSLSLFFIYAEQRSDTTYLAAYYDADGDFSDRLDSYDGLIRFIACDSEQAVKDMVLRGQVQCGYTLPHNLTADFVDETAWGAVTVWTTSDSYLTEITNATLFAQIYEQTASTWYTDYMSCTQSVTALENRLSDDSTFHLTMHTLATALTSTDDTTTMTYPLHTVLLIQLLLSALFGLAQAISDHHTHRYYKRFSLYLILLNVITPVVVSTLFSTVIIIIYHSY